MFHTLHLSVALLVGFLHALALLGTDELWADEPFTPTQTQKDADKFEIWMAASSENEPEWQNNDKHEIRGRKLHE